MALEKSMALNKGGDANDWFFLAMTHARLGRREQARSFYDRAMRWMKERDSQDETLHRFAAEAEALTHPRNLDAMMPNGTAAFTD